MYSSNSSINGNNLISYPNEIFSTRPFYFESNPTSKDESNCALSLPPPPPPPPLTFFQFPSSSFEENQISLEQHHDFSLLPEAVLNMEASISNTKSPEQIPRKRSSKRDRHSKIKTARGLRDRRMRLSLEVAKRFFGLQDMLGFDKASKTVEWLLNQAKVEIKQVARENNHHQSCSSVVGAKSASSTSECEGVSGLDEVVVSGKQEQVGEPQAAVKRRIIKLSRKSAFNPIGREKARERARERTKEKMRTRRLCNEETNQNLNLLGPWNPFETVEETVHQSQSVNPSLDVLAEPEEPSSHTKDHSATVHEDSLLIMSKWSPTMMFNSLNNSGILQEHQFAEFQFLGKPWEAYNNRI